MRQTVRALGWATAILWIILLLFTVTAAYSALQIVPRFGELDASASGGTLTASMPIVIYNGGFYDISKFNITTQIVDNQGSAIATSSTFVPLIPQGVNTTVTHKVSLSIEQAVAKNLTHLLFNDSDLGVEALVGLTYARVVPIEIGANFTMPWGAPLANLTLGGLSVTPYNATHVRFTIPFGFENHSFVEMNGTARIELVDNLNRVAGSNATGFDVPPDSPFHTDVQVFVPNDRATIRQARLFFTTPFFTYGPLVIALG